MLAGILALVACVSLTGLLASWLAGLRRETDADTGVAGQAAAEARVRFLDEHDALTGLANRRRLQARAAEEMEAARRDGGWLVVLCLDLDRFKTINDMLGHQAGDLLLQQVAARIQASVRSDDVTARVSGDEFVVLLREDAEAGGIVAGCVADRLIETLSEPYDLTPHGLDGAPARVGVSVGVARFPEDGETVETLLQNADLALYNAKAHGRGGLCHFQADMGKAQRERRALEHDLAGAIAGGGLHLAFQPLFDSTGRSVVAFEALARWEHQGHGFVSPAKFIPVAEATGLIIPLGKWVLETACRTAATWLRPCRVAVNVSARQVRAGDLPATVADILARTGLPASRLELEVTESLLIDDAAQALETLRAIKALGVRIVLDDFGTGYSGLAYLQQFPFDMVKIDKSFTDRITTDPCTRAIVSAIVSLSHRLDLEVTAEGVETADQLEQLRLEACDQIQGYLLGRPMAAGKIADFLENTSTDNAAA